MFNPFFQSVFSQGARRASNSVPQTFPLTAITGCIANWRADAGVTWNGTRVTNWTDQSGFGWDLAGSAGPGRTLSNPDFNNHPTLNFNGSSQFLVSSYAPQNGGAGENQTGTTFVVVMKQKRQTSFNIIFFWGENDNNKNRLSTGNAGDANKFRYDVSLSGSHTTRQMNAAFNVTSSYNVMSTYNRVTNGNLKVFMNGVETTNGAVTISNKASEGRFTVGRQVDAANYSEMEIAEIAVFKVDLSQHPAAFQEVLQYVSSRYGIASGSF
jgi:hypothetical protein